MHRLEVPMPNMMPFAIGTFDTIGPLSRADFPHRHTFYEIVHVTAGTGAHVVDLARWELRPPHLGVIAPGQVHHWEGTMGLTGSVVLFTEDFLLDHPGDRELLRRLGERPWRDLDGPTHERTARLIADLDDEYRTGADGFATVLRALLHILVVRAARLPEPAAAPPPTRTGAVAEEFVRLISRNDPALWSVRGCADRIGVSGGYLTEAVKAATGRAPGRPVLTTQLYFPNEPRNNTDSLFDPRLLMTVRDSGGVREAAFDFVLDVPQNSGPGPTGSPTTPPPGGTWAVGTTYAPGARVTHGGGAYVCLQGHVAQPGWEPPSVPALWRAE